MAMTSRWMFVGGPLDGLHAEPRWKPAGTYWLPTGDAYECKAFVDGGGIMLHVDPLPVARAPTRPLTATEVDALRSMQERPVRIEICYPASEARPNHVSDAARREMHCERIRRLARWACGQFGRRDWASALCQLDSAPRSHWPVDQQLVKESRDALGEDRCAEIYSSYVDGDPCEAPCGERSCGASGGACRKGIPR